MKSPPWMKFYIHDYLADTGHLSTIEHGAYMLLLMAYWDKGGLPKDEDMIRRITKMTRAQWSASRLTLKLMFLSGWKHKRVEAELAQAIERSRVNSTNVSKRYNGRSTTVSNSYSRLQTTDKEKEKEKEKLDLKEEKPVSEPAANGQFYAKLDSPEQHAWEKHRGNALRDRDGGWHYPSQWPPNHPNAEPKP